MMEKHSSTSDEVMYELFKCHIKNLWYAFLLEKNIPITFGKLSAHITHLCSIVFENSDDDAERKIAHDTLSLMETLKEYLEL